MIRAILGLVVAGSCLGQGLRFDVASVKASEPVPFGQNININLGTVAHGQLTLGNATLCESIRFAYGLVSDDQVAGPAWIKSREFMYDVVAKSGADTTREQALEMLQTLLTERFQLQMHREPRVVPHYELVIAKGGPKLKEAKPEATGLLKFGTAGLVRVSSDKMPMFRFVMLLSRQMRQAVLDKTGLTASYDLNLEWTPDSAAGSADAPTGVSVFTAIQEQLGLKLEPRKTPMEILVIDRAEKVPVAN